MKKPVIGAIVVVVIVAIAGGIVVATKGSNNDSSTDMSNMNMSSASKSTASDTNSTSSASNDAHSSPTSNASTVTIENFAFSPANITVKVGTTVTWTNKDSATHTVTGTDGKTGPDSGNLATGKSFSFKYDTVGTYSYHCAIHSNMTGTVTVTD